MRPSCGGGSAGRTRRCGAGTAALAGRTARCARTAPGCAPGPPRLAPGFCAALASLTLAVLTTTTTQLRAQSPLSRVFVGLGFGAGQVKYWSDQQPAERATTVTASLRFGVVVSPSLRVGWGEFNTSHPGDSSRRAFGAISLGVGQDVALSRAVSLTLAADWTGGPSGSVDNLVTTSTGRRFRAWDVNLGVRWH